MPRPDESLSIPLSDKFSAAFAFTFDAHRMQSRKGSQVPYLAHLMAVSSLVLEHGGTEAEAIAALLHDAVEDQGGVETAVRIRSMFGDHVADIVLAVTDTHESPKPPWRARKEAHVKHMQGASDSAKLVAAADKLHNARSLLIDFPTAGESLWERFRGGREGTIWYYRAMGASLRMGTANEGILLLCDELDRVVAAIESLGRTP
jgi:(p)ppGpp synthase/HD superfamily hydrolase